jgi:acetyl esterase/lipase
VGNTHPPFDPELASLVEAIQRAGLSTMTAEMIAPMRDTMKGLLPSDDELRRDGAVSVCTRMFPGARTEIDLEAILLRPAGAEQLAPGVLYLHGGGMVGGHHRYGLVELAAWVEQLGVAVVSVEYRLAPEHPHPTPVEDCYAALVWMSDNAVDLGIDASRLVIAGTSAGGGLAAGVALLARDRLGPQLAGQVLLAPMLDDRMETPSSYELEGEGVWDRGANITGWTALLGDDRGGPDVSPYAAPARAEDLSGLPPTYLDVGSVEVFRDEVIDFAARIWRAGGSAQLHVWSGAFHGFDLMAARSTLAHEAYQARLNWLRRLLAT